MSFIKYIWFIGTTWTIKYHCPNKWTPKDFKNPPQLELIEGQDLDFPHDCMPGPYDYLGHVFLRNCQKLLSENVTIPTSDLYFKVKTAIYRNMGVDGADLSPQLEMRRKDVMLALAPYNVMHTSLARERRKYIPADLESMQNFDQNHSWNFCKEENLCKYAGEIYLHYLQLLLT